MTVRLRPTYHPTLEPDRPTSYPTVLGRADDAFIPLTWRPRATTRTRLELVSDRWRLWGSFCVSDVTLAAFARHDPLGLATLSRLPVAGATTMDVPYYGFMTPAERGRALCRLVWAQHESLDAFDRLGLHCLPLVKGLAADEIVEQVDLLAEVGVAQAAFYARELRLEGDEAPLEAFVTACRRARVAPVLLGASRPVSRRRGPTAAAGIQHVVAARHRQWLTTAGRWRKATAPVRSAPLGRWVRPDDVAGLAAHNLLATRRRFEPEAGLTRFGA